jgi:hypothetical protein
MYSITLVAHNLVRWIVVLAGIWAVLRTWRGWMTRGVWTPLDLSAGKLFSNILGLQFVLGLILLATSPLVRQGFGDMGVAMQTRGIRFFIVEHPITMILAIALAQIGMARVKRATSDSARFQTGAIFWGIALAAVLGGIPWDRPFFPS